MVYFSKRSKLILIFVLISTNNSSHSIMAQKGRELTSFNTSVNVRRKTKFCLSSCSQSVTFRYYLWFSLGELISYKGLMTPQYCCFSRGVFDFGSNRAGPGLGVR
jgi:hypothetical protein